jgi:cytochrome P450
VRREFFESAQKARQMNDSTPPGPRGQWGGLNHLRAIRADFRAFAHSLHQQYGDVVTYRVLGQPVYQFASPALAHEVLVEKARSLQKPDNQKRAFGRIIGNNLFTSDGDPWVARRRLLGPLFLPQSIDRYREIVLRQAAHEFDQLSEGEVNVSLTANTIALLSVAESLFGARIQAQSRKFLEVATRLQAAVTRQILSPMLMPLWMPTSDNRTIRDSLRFFHGMISALIAEHRQSTSERPTLLAALLSATDSEDGTRLSDQEAMDEALTMLLAGSDTTAAALSWSAYLLAKYPDIQNQLRSDVNRITGGGSLTAEHAGVLRLAERVFKESLRLYPPAIAIARQAAEPVVIGGVEVPRGALVFVIVYSIHHDPRWFPAPEVFDPHRFGPPSESAIPEHAYLPFGLGPRACIGRRFAMMEGPLVLADMVRRFEFRLIESLAEPELETQLSLHPRNGLRLEFKRCTVN